MVWAIFIAVVTFFLALDLGVFNKEAHEISQKEATRWTILWVIVALLFGGVLYWLFDHQHIDNPMGYTPRMALSKYLQAYLIELSLSFDNIFVIAVIFQSFRIPKKYQHEVLFWGIIGAIIFRAIMIFFGIWLISKIDWITYIFGAFLIFTAYKMVAEGPEDAEFDPKKNRIFNMIRRVVPISRNIHGQKLLIRRSGMLIATPLLVALIVIEFTDILFALDSIPAVLAITEDPFIVFSSNIMAILGLRSMYFFLANIIDQFSYLKYSLAVILLFVGIKMVFHNYFMENNIDLPEWLSLGVISVSLVGGILFSLYKNKKSDNENKPI